MSENKYDPELLVKEADQFMESFKIKTQKG